MTFQITVFNFVHWHDTMIVKGISLTFDVLLNGFSNLLLKHLILNLLFLKYSVLNVILTERFGPVLKPHNSKASSLKYCMIFPLIMVDTQTDSLKVL